MGLFLKLGKLYWLMDRSRRIRYVELIVGNVSRVVIIIYSVSGLIDLFSVEVKAVS